jgi:hypothetical protein
MADRNSSDVNTRATAADICCGRLAISCGRSKRSREPYTTPEAGVRPGSPRVGDMVLTVLEFPAARARSRPTPVT